MTYKTIIAYEDAKGRYQEVLAQVRIFKDGSKLYRPLTGNDTNRFFWPDELITDEL